MDFSDIWLILSGMIIGSVGIGVFIYGKRMQSIKCLGVGLTMAAYPYFVGSLLVMWVIAVVCVAALKFLPSE